LVEVEARVWVWVCMCVREEKRREREKSDGMAATRPCKPGCDTTVPVRSSGTPIALWHTHTHASTFTHTSMVAVHTRSDGGGSSSTEQQQEHVRGVAAACNVIASTTVSQCQCQPASIHVCSLLGRRRRRAPGGRGRIISPAHIAASLTLAPAST
jgi:hypothetical protein